MRITILGAGFTGSTLATVLASTSDDAPDVCLVGVASSFARGVAYGEARPEHLLNVRARHLGAEPGNPAGFAEWLNLSEQGATRSCRGWPTATTCRTGCSRTRRWHPT